MDERQIRALIERLRSLHVEVRDITEQLASLGIQIPPIVDSQRIDDLSDRLTQLADQQAIHFALTRIDFDDSYYAFVRAIDGDTIVVEPPKQLRQWMKDVHIRLYGLETPELWEELGQEYRQHLEELCSIDARGRLMIVWERERPGTQYEGFPLSTFERGIGHVFFRSAGRRYYYVNALMHLLKYSSLHRDGRNLLRGAHAIRDIDLRIPYSGRCATQLDPAYGEPSATFRQISEMGPPVCLLSYPKLPSLDPRDDNFDAQVLGTIRNAWDSGCPFQPELLRQSESLIHSVMNQRASPFDIPLTLISIWATERHAG